jgi:hypothetical protein
MFAQVVNATDRSGQRWRRAACKTQFGRKVMSRDRLDGRHRDSLDVLAVVSHGVGGAARAATRAAWRLTRVAWLSGSGSEHAGRCHVAGDTNA